MLGDLQPIFKLNPDAVECHLPPAISEYNSAIRACETGYCRKQLRTEQLAETLLTIIVPPIIEIQMGLTLSQVPANLADTVDDWGLSTLPFARMEVICSNSLRPPCLISQRRLQVLLLVRR